MKRAICPALIALALLASVGISSAEPQTSGTAAKKTASAPLASPKTAPAKKASPPATPDQKYTCKANGQGDEHFIVNFGAKTVKTGDVILGGGAPREWQVTDVRITDDSIAFTLGGKINFGAMTIVRTSKITIDRKDGAYTIQTSDNPPSPGTCTVDDTTDAAKPRASVAPSTSLLDAATKGDAAAVQQFIDKGSDVNASGDGGTPLLFASRKGDAPSVKLLLAAGANPNAISQSGITALFFASQSNFVDVAKLLLEGGASPNTLLRMNGNTGTALVVSCIQGHPDIVRLLLAKGADVNLGTEIGYMPLMAAGDKNDSALAASGRGEIPEADRTAIGGMLIKAGAKVNAADKRGATALWLAAGYGHSEVVKLLIAAHANVNYANPDNGWTPLWVAAVDGRTSVVKLLLAAGANPALASSDKLTPLMAASRNGHTDVVQLLKSAGAVK